MADPDPGAPTAEYLSEAPDEAGGWSMSWVTRVGLWAWSFVGFVVALGIVTAALGVVNEIVLPMTFAAVLAVIFKPAVGSLQRRGLKPSLGAGLVVLGLLAGLTIVLVAVVRGDPGPDRRAQRLGHQGHRWRRGHPQRRRGGARAARAALEESGPAIGTGFLSELMEGIDSIIALASGLILGALIMYYLLKDGSQLRRSVVGQFSGAMRQDVDDYLGSTCRILRDYGRGRSAMSAIVAVVIGVASLLLGLPLVFTIVVANFIGGYIPYIGAFLGGGLAVIVAFGEGGIETAAIMLVVVVAANLLLENFVEPKVMGRTLDVHPLVVLVVTALGGLLGGIVGLILAVPFFVIARDGIARLRAAGLLHPGGHPRRADHAPHAQLRRPPRPSISRPRALPSPEDAAGAHAESRARWARLPGPSSGACGPPPGPGRCPRCGR